MGRCVGLVGWLGRDNVVGLARHLSAFDVIKIRDVSYCHFLFILVIFLASVPCWVYILLCVYRSVGGILSSVVLLYVPGVDKYGYHQKKIAIVLLVVCQLLKQAGSSRSRVVVPIATHLLDEIHR